MKLFKKILAGAVVATTLLSNVNATPVTISGFTWDPASIINFTASSLSIRQFIDSSTGIVSGFGTINQVNGSSNFCSNCEVTFHFGGFIPLSDALTPTPGGGTLLFTAGSVEVFVSAIDPLNSNSTTMTFDSTGDGTLWLGMVGHIDELNSSFLGTTAINGSAITGLTGVGNLDVLPGLAGGVAGSYFDTNTIPGGSDFSFSTSYTSSVGNDLFTDSIGTSNFKSKSLQNNVPEPTSMALVGLGLLGMGAMRRRTSIK